MLQLLLAVAVHHAADIIVVIHPMRVLCIEMLSAL